MRFRYSRSSAPEWWATLFRTGRSYLPGVAVLMAAVCALVVGLQAPSMATVSSDGYSLTPQGQVASSNSGGSCKVTLTAVITAPTVEEASSIRKSIDSMGSVGIFKEGVQTVSSRVTQVSGGGKELVIDTTVTLDCALFKSGSNWRESVMEGSFGVMSGVVGGATYHLVNALALGTLAAAGVPDGSGSGSINWRAKIAGCLSGAASGFVTLALATARTGSPGPAAITGNAIGSCLGGSVLTGFDPQNTWDKLAALFHQMRGWSTSLWLSQDVENVADQADLDIEAPVEQALQQEESAMQTCSSLQDPDEAACR